MQIKLLLKSIAFAVLTILLQVNLAGAAWIGESSPEFTLKKIDSNSTISLKDLKGKVVFIDFWASWCGPCKKELPALNKLYAKVDRDKVIILAINLDKKVKKAAKFIKKVPVDFPVLLDSNSKLVKQFGARAMPTSYILDQNGIIQHVHLGFNKKDPAKWEKEINNLLKRGEKPRGEKSL